MRSIPDILNVVVLRSDNRLYGFQDASQILQNINFRTKSEGSGDDKKSSCTVGEAFGVSKNQI